MKLHSLVMLATVNSTDKILLLSTATIKVLPLFESSNKQHMVPVLENDLLVLFFVLLCSLFLQTNRWTVDVKGKCPPARGLAVDHCMHWCSSYMR